jgi:hypothetical protein
VSREVGAIHISSWPALAALITHGFLFCTCLPREMLGRLEDVALSGDVDLLVDWRTLNGSKEKVAFDSFWEVAHRMIETKFDPRVSASVLLIPGRVPSHSHRREDFGLPQSCSAGGNVRLSASIVYALLLAGQRQPARRGTRLGLDQQTVPV